MAIVKFSTKFILILILIQKVISLNVQIPPNYLEKCFENDQNAINGQIDDPSNYSKALILGLHKFSISLLKSLHNFEPRDTSKGLVFSPFSVWSALIVSYMGAANSTEHELRTVLGLDKTPKYAIGMAYQGLRFWYQLKKNISSNTKDYFKKQAYSVANRIFINNKLPISKCILQNFAIEAQPIDFSTNSSRARQLINHWVEKETHGKIKDLLPHGSVNSWTTIIIANAIYFYNKWYNQFDQTKNQIKSFYITPTEKIETTFMTLTANLMYGVSETLKATLLELPYANQDFSMMIILPEANRGVDGLIKHLNPSNLEEAISNMYDDEIIVYLPKFKSEQDLDLAGPLYSMGVKKLFDPRYANLSGFFAPMLNKSVNSLQAKGIVVNSVAHKAFISVNEEGTEAAASTAILLSRSGRPAFPTQFSADRPFLFLLRDTATNIILFIGIVRRPTQ